MPKPIDGGTTAANKLLSGNKLEVNVMSFKDIFKNTHDKTTDAPIAVWTNGKQVSSYYHKTQDYFNQLTGMGVLSS